MERMIKKATRLPLDGRQRIGMRDMEVAEVKEDDVMDRTSWQMKIRAITANRK